MRICLFSQEDVVRPQGGTGTYARNVGLALAARGHQVHVVSRHIPGAPLVEVLGGVRVHRVRAPGPPVLYNYGYYKRSLDLFLELTRRQRFDVIVGNLPLNASWGIRAPDLPPVVEVVHCTVREELAILSRSSPRHLNFNEVVARAISPLWLRQEKLLLRRARRVIAVSEGLKQEVAEQHHYPGELISVIPNGVDYARFTHVPPRAGLDLRGELGIAPDAPVVLYLGRLMERKRVVDLLAAMPMILAQLPAARLVIVGRRNRHAEDIERRAQEMGVAERVLLLDHVPYEDVPRYYAMASVYCLPSEYEGFPFTVIEAMAAGTPVVASRIKGIDEQIADGITGQMHPVGDTRAIASCVLRVLTQPELARRLSGEARRLVEERYDWTAIGKQTEQVLAEAAA